MFTPESCFHCHLVFALLFTLKSMPSLAVCHDQCTHLYAFVVCVCQFIECICVTQKTPKLNIVSSTLKVCDVNTVHSKIW